MKPYFDKLFKKLNDNFNANQAPHYTILKPDWTNNNSESLNHVLKQKVSWKSCDLPQLIMKLKKVVQAQYSRTEKALVGLSRWKLDSQYQRFFNPEQWLKKSPQSRENWLKKFLSTPKLVHSGLVKSSDGLRSSFFPKTQRKKKPASLLVVSLGKTLNGTLNNIRSTFKW